MIRVRPARADDVALLPGIERAAGQQFRDIGMVEIAEDEPLSLAELAGYQVAGHAWVAVDLPGDERGPGGATEVRGYPVAPEARGDVGATEERGDAGAADECGYLGATEESGHACATDERGYVGATDESGHACASDERGYAGLTEVLAGYLIAEPVDGNLHIEQVSVHPRWARRGVGRLLIAELARHGVASGVPALTLTTFAEVAWNAPYYLRCGFTVVDGLTPGLRSIREQEAARGLDRWPRVCMRRELTSADGADRQARA